MISVCIATYNGEKFIKEQLNSILNQLEINDEIIVSDDKSTDNTIHIINSFNDPRIKIINFNRNKTGYKNSELVSSNFENAIKNAKGDYIFLSDQDDIWREDKIKVISPLLDKNDLVISNANLIINGQVNHNKYWFTDKLPIKNYCLRRGKYHGCCMSFRKEMLKYILPFPQKLTLHDSWIGLICELMGRTYFINMPLIFYRIHQNNASTINNSFIYKLTYRINLLFKIYYKVFIYKIRKK